MFTITPKINKAIILASQVYFDKFRKVLQKKLNNKIVREYEEIYEELYNEIRNDS